MKLDRLSARAAILKAANKQRELHQTALGTRPRFYAKHLQRAVFVCRQHHLVKPDVLAAAGFHA